MRTHITVLSASGLSLLLRAAQMSCRAMLRWCQRLYARMCCGRGGSLGPALAALVDFVVELRPAELDEDGGWDDRSPV